jgi:hypothetical protein
VLASTDLRKYRVALNLTSTPIFLGCLARLTRLEPSIVFGPELVVSTMVELVGMPALIVWLTSLTRTPAALPAHQPA